MANITIRDLPDKTKETLRIHAAQSGISLEAYVRYILQKASHKEYQPDIDIMASVRKYFGKRSGIDIELPPRCTKRKQPEFEE